MIDIKGLKSWWDTFVGEGNFTEVRILGRFQYSGYFKSFDNLCTQLEPFTNMDDEQIYFVLNQIDSSCYARPQCEKFLKSVKVSTNDNDIVRRKFLMIDCDAIRKSSTNSSDSEYNAALQKARDIFRFLREQGFDDPIVCTSGNGAHLQIPVDLPNDEETTEIVKRFYKFLGSKFTDNQVDIDQKVYNLARLCKTYSTTAKKGANLPERPWRKAEILYIPKELNPTPIEKIKELADLAPKEEPKVAPNRRPMQQGMNQQFDLVSWLNQYGIEYREVLQGGTTKYELKHCPWESEHSSIKEYESALFQNADGQITFSCYHSHCKSRTWFEFRQIYEPDAYNKPTYQPQQVVYIQQPKVQKPKYEIKEEIPELGEKWLSLSSIKKVDITKLEKVKTGFTELDYRIGGLYMSEVTILSGSNGSGKSSWLNTLVLNVIQQNYKVALWSGELSREIFKSWLQMPAAGARNLQRSQFDEGRYYVPDSVGQKIDDWLDGKFFLYNNEYGSNSEQVMNDMTLLLKAGVKVFVLDNLMSMSLNGYEGDKCERQKAFILDVKSFAMKNNVHIILVAHPRKSTAFLRKNDISGSANITDAADNCWILHRTNQDFLHAITEFYDASYASRYRQYGNVLSLEKSRLWGAIDYMCGFHYDLASRRFKNTPDEDIHYGWEQEQSQTNIHFQEVERNEDEVIENAMFKQLGEQEAPF